MKHEEKTQYKEREQKQTHSNTYTHTHRGIEATPKGKQWKY